MAYKLELWDDVKKKCCIGDEEIRMAKEMGLFFFKGEPGEKFAVVNAGFGLGTGTVAEGWINDAAAFWEAQSE